MQSVETMESSVISGLGGSREDSGMEGLGGVKGLWLML